MGNSGQETHRPPHNHAYKQRLGFAMYGCFLMVKLMKFFTHRKNIRGRGMRTRMQLCWETVKIPISKAFTLQFACRGVTRLNHPRLTFGAFCFPMNPGRFKINSQPNRVCFGFFGSTGGLAWFMWLFKYLTHQAKQNLCKPFWAIP